MSNPLSTLAKPLAFGARQAFNVTSTALRVGGAWVGTLRGGHPESPPEPAPAPAPRRPRASTQPKALDDVSITRKVETKIFRDRGVPKGKIDVNTADGVVWLRGEASNPEMIKRLEREASQVPEVKRVENLLHLPKTPAPSRSDTPASQRKTRRSKPAASARKVSPSRVTAERQPLADVAEPAPAELAQQGKGRQAAPLGARDAANGGSAEGTSATKPARSSAKPAAKTTPAAQSSGADSKPAPAATPPGSADPVRVADAAKPAADQKAPETAGDTEST